MMKENQNFISQVYKEKKRKYIIKIIIKLLNKIQKDIWYNIILIDYNNCLIDKHMDMSQYKCHFYYTGNINIQYQNSFYI